VLVAAAGVFLIALAPANAGMILDQESPHTNTSFNADYSGFTWQQEVTVGLAGPLVAIELYVTGPGSTEVFLNVGSPWQYDAHDFVTTFSADSTGWALIDTSSVNLVFDVDDTFVIGIHGIDGGMWIGGSHPGQYDRGELYLNTNVYVGPGEYDHAFRTYVPEPGTLALLSLGALAMVSRRR